VNQSRGRWPGPVVAALTRFWVDDNGLSLFLLLLFFLIFVVPPLVPSGGGRSLAADLLQYLLLVSGVRTLGEARVVRWVLTGVALVAVAVDLGSRLVTVPQPWGLAMNLLSLVLFLAVVLGRTLRPGPVTRRRLEGGIAAYLLLGVIWAFAYALVERLVPAAFSGPVGPGDAPRTWFYFSFATLTTVGYGDVLPVHPVARSLAMLEAVVGPLYLAILISRLVSLTAGAAAGELAATRAGAPVGSAHRLSRYDPAAQARGGSDGD
jgi:hypothetical protein